MENLNIIEADLSNPVHAKAVLDLTRAYARDFMGLDSELPEEVRENLIAELKTVPGAICFLAWSDGQPIGIANCFYSFSTFYARKLINIHDLAVLPELRGMGIGQALLEAVEEKARATGCCKLTLEVREDNRARSLYEKAGFDYGDPVMYFMEKELE